MDINWWTLALQALNFLVLVWLLQRLLYQPVQRVLARRREEVETAFARAAAAQAEADRLERQLREQLAAIDSERKRILDKAQKEIEVQRQAVLSEAKEQARQEIETVREQLERERRETISALRAELAGLAASLAARILAEQGEDRGAAVALNALLRDFDALPAREQAEWLDALAAAGGRLQVATAVPLAAPVRTHWSERLRERFGDELAPEFKVDTGLLGGAEWRLPNRVLSRSWRRLLGRAEELLRGERHAEG